MGTKNRDHLVKPDDMSDADFQGLKDATASLERIRGDAHADVELYLANPDGWSTGSGSRSGLPTLLLIRSDAKADVQAYLANPAGRAAGTNAQGGFPTLLLTTVGRKSGEKRTTPAVFMRHGKDLVIVGSLAGYDTHPAWYLNLQAQPNCWVQLDRNKSKAAARDATAAEREQLWPRLTALFPPWGYFQKQTDRPFAIVIITPSAAA